MKSRVAMKGLMALLWGLALLTTAGCLGGSKNFTTATGSVAQAAQASDLSGGTPARRDVGPRVGNVAPDFALKGLDGNVVRLSDLRGKPVLINFWATWCPPCKEEMPTLQAAYQKYRDQGTVFLGVDLKEDAGTIQDFVQKNGYRWTFLLDPEARVSTAYQVSAIPTTYFIDGEGIVRDSHLGAISPATLETKLAKIR